MAFAERIKHVNDSYRRDQIYRMEYFCLGDKFLDLTRRDEEEKFVLEVCWTVNEFGISQVQPLLPEIMSELICQHALKCIEALVTGQTPLVVDLNLPCSLSGMTPIHLAVSDALCTPCMIELLLYYGARTDIRFMPPTKYWTEYTNMIPLQIALLRTTTEFPCLLEWSPKHSVFKLISSFCVPRLQNQLEVIALLAGMTKETEEVFFEYAVQGKYIEFAALLMVAHKKLNNVMHKVGQYFESIENNNPSIGEDQKEKVASMRQLVAVFEKAGDDISTYLKEDKFYVSKHDTVTNIMSLLLKAGFQLQQSDVDLSCYSWFQHKFGSVDQEAPYEGNKYLFDFSMEHYSKSGYRWTVSKKDPWWRFSNKKAYLNELKDELDCLKAEREAIKGQQRQVYVNELKNNVEGSREENENLTKQQQQENIHIWMDDKLERALKEDDTEEFLSIIKHRLDFFRSRQPLLLDAICRSGSIKCAEALVKSDTCLVVDLNHSCADTGMYPLHRAALSLFPSVVELFLCYGAWTDVTVGDCIPEELHHRHSVLEAHANKLPLDMALWGICHLPCINEWTPKHTIAKLITLLCLPRMQNALETLSLLVGTTGDILDVYKNLAVDGKVVELAAMLVVADDRFYYHSEEVYACCMSYKEEAELEKDQRQKLESVVFLLEVFHRVGYDISEYVKEDKYNVTKYQVIKDVRCILGQGFHLAPSDTDLSVYNWYRDEEPSYPMKAPYENVRLSHDVGMEHYFLSGYRWKVKEMDLDTWRYSMVKEEVMEMENQIKYLQEENAKNKKRSQKVLLECATVRMGCGHRQRGTYICGQRVPYIHLRGVPTASKSVFTPSLLNRKFGHGTRQVGEASLFGGLHHNISTRRIMTTMVSLL